MSAISQDGVKTATRISKTIEDVNWSKFYDELNASGCAILSEFLSPD